MFSVLSPRCCCDVCVKFDVFLVDTRDNLYRKHDPSRFLIFCCADNLQVISPSSLLGVSGNREAAGNNLKTRGDFYWYTCAPSEPARTKDREEGQFQSPERQRNVDAGRMGRHTAIATSDMAPLLTSTTV